MSQQLSNQQVSMAFLWHFSQLVILTGQPDSLFPGRCCVTVVVRLLSFSRHQIDNLWLRQKQIAKSETKNLKKSIIEVKVFIDWMGRKFLT